MVEEARLESVYTGNRIEGSNPSVSADSRLVYRLGILPVIHSDSSLFLLSGMLVEMHAHFAFQS